MKKQIKKLTGYENEENLVDYIQTSIKAHRTYVDNGYMDLWKKCMKVYDRERIPELVGFKTDTSDIYIPEMYSQVDAAAAAVGAAQPKITFTETVSSEFDTGKLDILNCLIDYWWSVACLRPVIEQALIEALIYGTSLLYFWWDDECVQPRSKLISIFDFFVDPNACVIEDASFAGHSYFTSLDFLKDNDEYENVDEIELYNATATDDESAKEIKEMFSTSNCPSPNQVKIQRFETRKWIAEVANGHKIVRLFKNDNDIKQKGQPIVYNYVPVYWDKNPHRFYGTGIIEPNIGAQERVNDLANMEADAAAISLFPATRIDPSQADKADKILYGVGAVNILPPGAVEPMATPNFTGSFSALQEAYIDTMRRTSGVNEVVQGFLSAGRRSATEIRSQDVRADARFARKVRGLESSSMKHIAKIMFHSARKYGKDIQVKLNGTSEERWEVFMQSDFKEDFIPHVMLEGTVLESQYLQAQEIANTSQIIGTMPFLNQEEWLLATLPLLAPSITKNVRKFVRTPEQVNDAARQGALAIAPELAPQSALQQQLGPQGPPINPEEFLGQVDAAAIQQS